MLGKCGVSEAETEKLDRESLFGMLATLRRQGTLPGTIVDLNQNPSFMLTASGAVPCLLSKCNNLYSLRKRRAMVPCEALAVQGLDTVGLSSWSPPWSHKVHELPSPDIYDLAGNGIHVHVATAILAFTLCTLTSTEASEKETNDARQ